MKSNQKNQNKKERTALYESIFLQSINTTARDGKSVYIAPEFHERLAHIVHVIGENKITIYSYLHHVLEQHFQDFGEEIRTIYNDKNKPIL